MSPPTLLAVPNVSEGRDAGLIERLGHALLEYGTPDGGPGARLLDVHSDADHDRSVFTLAAQPKALQAAVFSLASAVLPAIDLRSPGRVGQHPHVGALDVAPVVFLRPEDRGAACAEALVIAERIGCELRIPVFLYGELTADKPGAGRARADLRRGGLAGLAARMADGRKVGGSLAPDFGPGTPHPTAGVTLVSARPPLVAFNLRLARSAGIEDARRIAALIREGELRGSPG